jgi:hypothetical protein
VNRIKATLARLGIRDFKPTLRKAAERLATVHTPEGMPLPPNALAELQHDMARLGFVVSQIREIEDARQKRLRAAWGAWVHSAGGPTIGGARAVEFLDCGDIRQNADRVAIPAKHRRGRRRRALGSRPTATARRFADH